MCFPFKINTKTNSRNKRMKEYNALVKLYEAQPFKRLTDEEKKNLRNKNEAFKFLKNTTAPNVFQT